jgi:hypothetical protein
MTSITDPTPRGESLYDCEGDANAVETLMANTIIAKIKLIAKGALLPESLRFESEPWAVFYMAGEIIRELRKASENKKVNIPTTKNDMRKAAWRPRNVSWGCAM